MFHKGNFLKECIHHILSALKENCGEYTATYYYCDYYIYSEVLKYKIEEQLFN